MSRNIIVFADGTGNSAAKAFKTNVWRLYQALDLTGGGQIAVFSDGVGTSQFKPFEIIGLALGFGVRRRVLALYKFLCLNYQEGDRIFAFGFSRGAFTIRVLVGLIAREGLVDFKSEEELDRNARAAYRTYRPKAFGSKLPWVRLARFIGSRWYALWNEITGSRAYDEVQPKRDEARSASRIEIAFLGVWDTVSAYGLPVDELTKAVDRWVWPITFERTNLLPAVQCARQAFSIDDERRTFFPIPWTWFVTATPQGQADRQATAPDDKVPDLRLKQVWFAGCHANVGGGYPDDRLAHIPLCWMIGEAAEQGLRFKDELVADYWDYASVAGRIYDSRSGFGVFYRYHPRPVEQLVGDGARPLVDASVIVRMAKGCDDYAPISLPHDIDVLSPLGVQVSFNGHPTEGQRSTVETVADKLPLPRGRKRDLAKMDREFQQALGELQENGTASGKRHTASRDERMQLMLDTVWWRRGLYYALLSIAVLFLTFPLLAGYVTLNITDRIEQAANGVIGPALGLISGLLPSFAAPWVEAMAKHSILAVLLGLALGVLLWANGLLRVRINNRARAAWNVKVERNAVQLQSNRSDAHRRTSLIGTIGFGFGALALLLAKNEAAGFFAAAFLFCLAIYAVLTRRGTHGQITDRPISLQIARAIRTSKPAQSIYDWLRGTALPLTFLVLSIGLVLLAANKAAFEVADSMGMVCEPPQTNPTGAERLVGTPSDFKTKDICTDTGNWLQEGVRYEVAISINRADRWADGSLCADTRGVQRGSVAHYFATLLKRRWSEPYFKPIARIGPFGNDEYLLEPVEPTAPGSCLNDELTAEIKPKTSGELYVYVNDAVLALPTLRDFYYRHNNSGSAKISVKRVNAFP